MTDNANPNPNPNPNPDFAGTDADILAIAQPIFDDIMAAHEEADYARLLPWLSAEMREALDEATFEGIVAEHLAPLGDLVSVDYLGHLKKGDALQLLWKASYGATDVQLLWQVFLAQGEEQLEVVGLLFS